MIKDEICQLLKEILPDKDIKNDLDRLVTVGSDSILALNFVIAIEDYYNIEIDNDYINHKFYSDFDYIIEVIEKSKETVSG